jgi:hypothetical protein
MASGLFSIRTHNSLACHIGPLRLRSTCLSSLATQHGSLRVPKLFTHRLQQQFRNKTGEHQEEESFESCSICQLPIKFQSNQPDRSTACNFGREGGCDERIFGSQNGHHSMSGKNRRNCASTIPRKKSPDYLIFIGGGSATGLGKVISFRNTPFYTAILMTYAGGEVTTITRETVDGKRTTHSDIKEVLSLHVRDIESSRTIQLVYKSSAVLTQLSMQ